MHLKRNKMPNTWPVARKGTKYIVNASHAKTKAIPLLFILREILKLAKTRKEAEYILHSKEVKVNNKIRTSEKFPVQVFDIVSFEKTKKHYKLTIVNKKFKLEEISEKDSGKKIVKIIGKSLFSKKRIQMNLEDGQNFIAKEKFSLGDSAIINTKEMKIEKILPLKQGADIEVVSGKHAGEKGKLKSIEKLSRGKRYIIKLQEKEVGLPLKTILVVE